jgi:histidinol-phosphate phosphatase family protein
MNRAVFLDRDGIINRRPAEHDYVKSWEEFVFLPGVVEVVKALRERGFLIVVVTNQRGVARGLTAIADLEEIHRRMKERLEKENAVIDGIYVCPHCDEDLCDCRKPEPGLLLKAKDDLDIDLSGSYMIGDSPVDIEAGKTAGCRTIMVVEEQMACLPEPDYTVKSLDRVLSFLF